MERKVHVKQFTNWLAVPWRTTTCLDPNVFHERRSVCEMFIVQN